MVHHTRLRTEASSALSVKTAKRCLAADNKPAALPVKLPAVLAMPMRSLRPIWVGKVLGAECGWPGAAELRAPSPKS